MILDDVYGSEFDRIPLTQECPEWNDAIPELEWDDTEIESIANELTGRRQEKY